MANSWQPIVFSEDAAFRWRLAGADIVVRRRGNCWNSNCQPVRWEKRRAGECTGPEAVPAQAAFPDGAGGPDGADTGDLAGQDIPGEERCGAVWGSGFGPVTAVLAPRMEERPFLIRPAEKLRIFPGMETTLVTALPLVLQFAVKNAGASAAFSGDLLFTLRPFILKETWFGATTMKGMFCLSLPVDADTISACDTSDTADAVSADTDTLIRCSILIRNKSKTVLELEKFLLHAAELSLYEAGGRLLSETPVIDADGNGDFHIGFRPPEAPPQNLPQRQASPQDIPKPALVAAGNKNDARDTLFHQGSRIIKHITGL